MSHLHIDPLVHVGRMRAWWAMLWGPDNPHDNPLAGPRYDPLLRDRIRAARRHARVVRREFRRMGPRWVHEISAVDPTPVVPSDDPTVSALAENPRTRAAPNGHHVRAVV